MSDETEEEINEIITKNFLASKNIPFKKLGEYADKGGNAQGKDEAPKDEAGKYKADDTKTAAAEENNGGDSPGKVEDEGEAAAEWGLNK